MQSFLSYVIRTYSSLFNYDKLLWNITYIFKLSKDLPDFITINIYFNGFVKGFPLHKYTSLISLSTIDEISLDSTYYEI